MADKNKPEYMALDKRDHDKHDDVSYLIIYVNNLSKKHLVEINYPQNSQGHLVVRVNNDVMHDRPLPDNIIIKECKHKVKYGKDNGQITIKLKKVVARKWAVPGRWSPERL